MSQKPNPAQPVACLIITGALNAAFGLYGVVGGIMNIRNQANGPVTGSGVERLAYFAGQFAVILAFLPGLVAAPIIIYGAVKMSDGSSYGWAKAASILAIIPFTSFCFLVGAPIGIWALVVLSKPEVKMFFGRGGANYQPPPPPKYYSST